MTIVRKIEQRVSFTSGKSPFVLITLCGALVLSACGASDPESSQNKKQYLSDLSPSMTLNGTVVVEERDGSTVFDGWLSQTDEPELGHAKADEVINEDSCKVERLSAEASEQIDQPSFTLPSMGAAELPAQQDDEAFDSTFAHALDDNDHAARSDSRLSGFDALIKQQEADASQPIPHSAWRDEILSHGDTLTTHKSFSQHGQLLSNLNAMNVVPLMPLVWLVPQTGVMPSAASSLRWEPSFNEKVKIKLRLSAIDFTDSQAPEVVNIACDVVDDGLFTLPAEFQQALPDDQSGIVVYAVRERVQQINSNDSNVTVVQLRYPQPVKPSF